MKTFREWFEEFPEPYKTQAILNTEKSGFPKGVDTPCYTSDDLKRVLNCAFNFKTSHEGRDYWIEFQKTL